MKKNMALILSVLMLMMALLPVQILAEEDKGLENAIRIAREKFTIPAGLTDFNYSIRTEDSKRIWNLSWGTRDWNDGRVNVTIDENGMISNYSFYNPYESGQNQAKFPKYSRYEAKAKAEDFIKRINPELASQVKLVDNKINPIMEDSYYFNFVRLVDNIPFYSNNMSVNVKKDTGEIQNYYSNWNSHLVFPAASRAISLEAAQKAYKDKLGLKLVYANTYENEKLKSYPVYIPKYSNGGIDAITGEKADIYGYYGPYYGGYYGGMGPMYNMDLAGNEAGKKQASVSLTTEELKAVEEVSKLIKKEDAEKIARDVKVLDITGEFRLNGANLYKHWSGVDQFNWELNFIKEVKNKNTENRHVSVNIDARTGEIRSFYTYYPSKPGDVAKFDKEQSKTAVEKFLKEIQPDRFAQSEYDESINNRYDFPRYSGMEKELPRDYRFSYVRKVNGIQFLGDMISANYDAVNGKITGFDFGWSDIEFAPIDKVLPLDAVYGKMFQEPGLELQYMTTYPQEYYYKFSSMPGNENLKPEVKFVYAVKPDKPAAFDAFTGAMLNPDGKPYKEMKTAEYTDISGHYAEKQIRLLSEYGISLEGTEFRPDENIAQKDFLYLVCKTMNNYYIPFGSGTSNDKELEELYRYLIRESIVKENEKSPDSTISREESVKFIIRALKYSKIADIQGIFNDAFKDTDQINPELVGYVAIARGLNIISGDGEYFNPKSQLTRAQAMAMLYNYLHR